jgi:hypothetical protein
MARPFAVQYLIFCESVEYLDPARPYRDSVLNRVDYVLSAPPGTEFPFEPLEFWLFARFYWLRDRPGKSRPLTISCVWRDHPSGNEMEVWHRDIGAVRFHSPAAVIDRCWAFRNYEGGMTFEFPGLGRYRFELWYPVRVWPNRRVVAREHILVEVVP